MSLERKVVGFDRRIRRGWLDATAERVCLDGGRREVVAALDELLAEEVRGEGVHSARGKTETVLLRVWLRPATLAQPLHAEAVRQFPAASSTARLVLHWGLCLMAYPFFSDLVSIVGRLLDLQDGVDLSQVQRRMAEIWGERSTIRRAVTRVVMSLVDWNVLEEKSRGNYRPVAPIELSSHALQLWLLEAHFIARADRSTPFAQLVQAPALFPFCLNLSPSGLRGHPRLELIRLGLDEAVVVPREAGATPALAVSPRLGC
jgi:hypothetical protein